MYLRTYVSMCVYMNVSMCVYTDHRCVYVCVYVCIHMHIYYIQSIKYRNIFGMMSESIYFRAIPRF